MLTADDVRVSAEGLDGLRACLSEELIERHGHSQAKRMIPAVRGRITDSGTPVVVLAEAVPLFASVAAALAESAQAKQRSDRERQQRREQDEQA